MNKRIARQLKALIEPLVTLSIEHLSPTTRNLIQEEQLSVNVYPTLAGGFIYVGAPKYDTPLEADLATVFDAAEAAGVAWLKFDVHGAVIDGLPLFSEPGAAA